MTRRITIARDGTVKLRGRETRWRVKAVAKQFEHDTPYRLLSPEGVSRVVSSHRDALPYLDELTDEELMG